jgi:MFS family permease
VAARMGSAAGEGEPSQPALASQASEEKPKLICGLLYTTAFKLLVVVLIIVGIVLGLTVGNLDSRISDLLEWLEDNRVKGIAIYMGIYAGLTGTGPNQVHVIHSHLCCFIFRLCMFQ